MMDLQPILYNIYRRNLDVETQNYAIKRHEFHDAVLDHLEKIPVMGIDTHSGRTDMDMLQSTSC